MNQEPWRPKRGHMAMHCRARTGEVGYFLFASERPADRDPVTPVFPTFEDLAIWLKANGWRPMGHTGVGDHCTADYQHPLSQTRKDPQP